MTQRVIIWDGPDRCGKTNMAMEFSRRHGVPYFKNSLERDEFGVVDSEYFTKASRFIDTYMSAFLRDTGTSVVFDRNYPSEYAYPRIFGRKCDLDILMRIDDVHAELGTFIVVPYRTSYAGIYDDVHPQVTPDHLRRLDDMFQDFCAWTSCRTLRLNVDDEDLERELSEVERFVGIGTV